MTVEFLITFIFISLGLHSLSALVAYKFEPLQVVKKWMGKIGQLKTFNCTACLSFILMLIFSYSYVTPCITDQPLFDAILLGLVQYYFSDAIWGRWMVF
jgi:hypothetical protein